MALRWRPTLPACSDISLAVLAKKKEGSLLFSPDSRILVVGGGVPHSDMSTEPPRPGEVKFFEVASRKEILTLEAHSNEVAAMALSPDGCLLALCCTEGDEPVKVWDVTAVTGTSLRAAKYRMGI